jgi:hypothetical protein
VIEISTVKPAYGFALGLVTRSGIQIHHHDGSSAYKYTNVRTQISERTWNHIAVTVDGTKVRFYINGKNIGGDRAISVPV